MVLRVLIVFQVPADAAEFIDELEQLRNAQGGVVKRLAEARISHLVGSIHASASENEHATRIQRGAELFQNRRLLRERHVPDALPPRNEIIPPGKLPGADIGVVKPHLGVFLPREGEHFSGEIEALDLEAPRQQQRDDAPAAATTHVDGDARSAQELERTLVLGDAVFEIEFGSGPMMGDLVVVARGLSGFHRWDLRNQDVRKLTAERLLVAIVFDHAMGEVGGLEMGIGELRVTEIGDMVGARSEAFGDHVGIGPHPDKGQVRELRSDPVALTVFEERLDDAEARRGGGQCGDAVGEEVGKFQAHRRRKWRARRNGGAHGRRDIVVAFVKREPEVFGETLPEVGFADADLTEEEEIRTTRKIGRMHWVFR